VRVERDVFAQERQPVREREGAVAGTWVIGGVLLEGRRIREGEEALEERVQGDGLFARCEDIRDWINAAVSGSAPDDGALEAEVEVLRRLEREAEGVRPWTIRGRVAL